MVGRNPPHKVVETTVRTAAAETGFYRIDTDDVAESYQAGHDPEAVEKTLAAIEATATPLIGNLIAGRLPSSAEERFQLSLFVSLQYARGWSLREEINRLGTLTARSHLSVVLTDDRVRNYLTEAGAPDADADVEAFRDRILSDRGPTLQMSQPHMVQQTLKFAMDTMLPIVYFRTWGIQRFADPVLLTSDSPVGSWAAPRPDRLPVGIAEADEIYLPLDRRTVLVLTNRPPGKPPDTSHEAGARQVARINTAVAGAGHRWIYHHPEDDPLASIQVPACETWVEEVTESVEEPDGSVRIRGRYVRRPTR